MSDAPARHPEHRSEGAAPRPAPEYARWLRDIAVSFPDARPLVDEVVAGINAEVQERKARLQQVKQANATVREELARLREQFGRLRLGLLAGGLALPRPGGRAVPPSHLLVQNYFTLRNQEFLGLAQLIHETTHKHSPVGWQMALTRAVFEEGAARLVEALVCRERPAAPLDPIEEVQLVGEHRRSVTLALGEQVARAAGRELDANLRVALERVAGLGLELAWDVLVGSPAGWLILPARGSAFDPAWQQVFPGRPSAEARVGGVVFPGYVLRGAPDKVVEKALVYTEREPAPGAPPPLPPAGPPER